MEVARNHGVQLLVLPELFVLELDGMFDEPYSFPHERCPVLAPDLAAEAERARDWGMTVVLGSSFAITERTWVNRSPVLAATGWTGHQDKQIMTQWEAAEWGISPGEPLQTLPDPRLGVAVCYDIEFPDLARSLAEAGAETIAVPSYTETWQGHWRVRHSCHARAVELQVFVLHATLLGTLGREPVISSHGTAAVISPCLADFPPNGVLSETGQDEEGLAMAELDFDLLRASRGKGDVRNWEDRLLVPGRLSGLASQMQPKA
jgi:predicted amidohydrolase